MKSPEGYEKDQICSYLDTIGCWYFKPYMAGFGKTGVPDIVGCWNGTFFGIEVKRPGKEPTPMQHRRLSEIMHNGGLALWGTGDKVIADFEYHRAVNASR